MSRSNRVSYEDIVNGTVLTEPQRPETNGHSFKPAKRQPVEKVPPSSVESEHAVLGCALTDERSIDDLVGACNGNTQVFYDLRNQIVFDTMVEMRSRKEPVDVITVRQRLLDRDQLETVGGTGHIAMLPDCIPSASNAAYYMAIVVEKSILRSLLQLCTEVSGRVYEFEGDVHELMDAVERDVMAVRQLRRRDGGQATVKELIQGVVTDIERYVANKGTISGLATGLADFDSMTGGLQNTELTVIAGYPSFGKTSLAMTMAEHAAVDLGVSVGVFSLEMTARQIVFRLLCSRARVNSKRIRAGEMVEGDFPKLTGAAGKIASCNMHFEDTTDMTIGELRAKARRMVQSHGVKMFVVDYLQLLGGLGAHNGRSSNSRQEEVSAVSSGLKKMAMELNVPVVTMSQLNDDGKLRESRAIGQDADTVARLEKEDGQGPEDDDEFDAGDEMQCIPMVLRILKQRNGPKGKIRLTFLQGYTRFETAPPAEHKSRSKLKNEKA